MPPLLLALALVGGWDYAGFADEPGRSVPAPSPAPTPDRKPGRIDDAIFPPARPKPAAPAAPRNWRLADAAGQAWESPDKAWLEAFVADRNRRLVPVAAPPPVTLAPSACSGGACPTRR